MLNIDFGVSQESNFIEFIRVAFCDESMGGLPCNELLDLGPRASHFLTNHVRIIFNIGFSGCTDAPFFTRWKAEQELWNLIARAPNARGQIDNAHVGPHCLI